MSWILNTIIVSALIIMITHYLYDHFQEGGMAREQTTNLADLKTRQYKAIIEKMVKDTEEKQDEAKEDMDTELTEYMQSKIEA